MPGEIRGSHCRARQGVRREIAPRNGEGEGIKLAPLTRSFAADSVDIGTLSVDIDRAERIATITCAGRSAPPPMSADAMIALGANFWPLQVARELDDAILHFRASTSFDSRRSCSSRSASPRPVLAYDDFLDANKDHWLVNEIRQSGKRVLKRIDVTSRTLVALVEPGSCFAGTLAELVLAADRSYMLIGHAPSGDNRATAAVDDTLADVISAPTR